MRKHSSNRFHTLKIKSYGYDSYSREPANNPCFNFNYRETYTPSTTYTTSVNKVLDMFPPSEPAEYVDMFKTKVSYVKDKIKHYMSKDFEVNIFFTMKKFTMTLEVGQDNFFTSTGKYVYENYSSNFFHFCGDKYLQEYTVGFFLDFSLSLSFKYLSQLKSFEKCVDASGFEDCLDILRGVDSDILIMYHGPYRYQGYLEDCISRNHATDLKMFFAICISLFNGIVSGASDTMHLIPASMGAHSAQFSFSKFGDVARDLLVVLPKDQSIKLDDYSKDRKQFDESIKKLGEIYISIFCYSYQLDYIWDYAQESKESFTIPNTEHAINKDKVLSIVRTLDSDILAIRDMVWDDCLSLPSDCSKVYEVVSTDFYIEPDKEVQDFYQELLNYHNNN